VAGARCRAAVAPGARGGRGLTRNLLPALAPAALRLAAPATALAVGLAVGLPHPGHAAQAAPPRDVVSFEPARPLRGTLARLVVRPGYEMLTAGGETAGEPLHFERRGGGRLVALAPLPIEGDDSARLTLRLEHPDRTDTVLVVLPVARPTYRAERLRVDPRFARPDSAAAARIAREVEQALDVGRRSHDTPRLWSGAFRLPREARVTSVFGTPREFNGEVVSRHMGTDFAGAIGAPVRATARGVVALVADFYLAGTAVYLDHGAGLVTGYFHLSRADVAAGDTIRAGDLVGAVGGTGRVTGPHLHWVARYGVIGVDPMTLPGLRRRR
jgi:hypothetical protein